MGSVSSSLPDVPKFPADGPPTDWSAFWKWLRKLAAAVRGSTNFQGAAAAMSGNEPSKFPGALYYQTDRTVTYLALNGNWVYQSGEMRSTSQSLADVPGGLGTNDAGFRYRNSYFQRVWEWDGASFHYADSGMPAGVQVATSGPQPSGGLWQKCDGSSVACALDNASLKNLQASDTQPLNGNNPSIEGGPGGAPQVPKAGTLAQNVAVTVNNNTTGITATGVNSGSTTFSTPGTGSNFTVASNGHTHPITDPGHNHTTTVTQPTLNAPSEASGGLPLRVSMAWWMRR